MSSDPSSATPAQNSHRILVVDDNIDAAESLAMLLQLDGHSTRVAHDGPAALVAAREFLPATVFLDIGLPGMSGYEVARQLRAERGAALRLIALTGWGTDDDKRKAQAAGFDRHLVKPVDPTRLAAMLES